MAGLLSFVDRYKLRLTIQLVTLAAIGLLFMSFNTVMTAWSELADAQYEVGQARARTGLLAKANAAAADQHRYQIEREALQQKFIRAGFVPKDWTRRQLKVENAELHRQLVDVYISELKKQQDYFFVPEEFVLRTLHAGEGLFSWRRGESSNLHLSLKGDYYMRTLR